MVLLLPLEVRPPAVTRKHQLIVTSRHTFIMLWRKPKHVARNALLLNLFAQLKTTINSQVSEWFFIPTTSFAYYNCRRKRGNRFVHVCTVKMHEIRAM